MSTTTVLSRGPLLPAGRGPLSTAVLEHLRGAPLLVSEADLAADPFGDDLQLALYCCYELHYRGFAGVDPALEWDPDLLALRRVLELTFLQALRRAVRGGDDVAAEIAGLVTEDPAARGVSHHLRRAGELWQLREYVALRSTYHLKEADPQAWVIPRLEGAAKAALVSVEHDEYGGGRPERMHARLWGDMMLELGLSDEYGHYLDHAPAPVLAEVNFMSMAGLHRELRGALVGQFAVVELTSSPGSARLVAAAERLGCGPATVEFYAEHVEADAVHEQVVRHGIIAPLVADDPSMAADVVFGMQAAAFIDDLLGEHVLGRWAAGTSALTRPLEPR
ncbi:iron-containing redox enzyme family protein [Kineococcus rhizosphaerae]|uniref:Heme oxygenase-like protein n=1 Tax=Kineococcus rhizosphaerae TaxID=559628 RepID=A0A2T0R0A9_9ACTN|nr:iron-containing redox enzyme family protein [Kineococcus rhizosphaerae]PRY12540.1 heme oxygenase-like protein [Kineococcus rhizosphaerae]